MRRGLKRMGSDGFGSEDLVVVVADTLLVLSYISTEERDAEGD